MINILPALAISFGLLYLLPIVMIILIPWIIASFICIFKSIIYLITDKTAQDRKNSVKMLILSIVLFVVTAGLFVAGIVLISYLGLAGDFGSFYDRYEMLYQNVSHFCLF